MNNRAYISAQRDCTTISLGPSYVSLASDAEVCTPTLILERATKCYRLAWEAFLPVLET